MTFFNQITINEIIYLIYNNLCSVIDKGAFTCVNTTLHTCCKKTTYFLLNKFKLEELYINPKRLLFCINKDCLCFQERKDHKFGIYTVSSNACWTSTFYYYPNDNSSGHTGTKLSSAAKSFFGVSNIDGCVIDINDNDDDWFPLNILKWIKKCQKGTKITRNIPYCKACTFEYVNFGSHENGLCVSFAEGTNINND